MVSFDDISYEIHQFDCIAMIFVHIMPEKRETYFSKIISYLKPGGTIIFEAYSTEQLKYKTGGPQDVNLLYTKSDLEKLFNGSLSSYDICLVETNLSEGLLHNGKSSVIRMTGTK